MSMNRLTTARTTNAVGRPAQRHSGQGVSARKRPAVVRRAVIEDSNDQSAVMSTPTPTIHVRFMLPLSVNFGDTLVLCGASPELGNWDPMAAPKFAWSSPDIWILDAELPAATSTEFKVVHLTASGETIWEYTNNRVIDIPSAETMKDGEVTLAWCDEAAEVSRPKILSSLASWDEEDGSAQGGSSMPFGNLFGFMSSADGEEIVGEASVVVDEEIVESEAEETVEAVAEVMEVEEEEEKEKEEEDIDDSSIATAATTTTIIPATEEDEVEDDKTDEPLSEAAKKKNAATARALKNVTTAGVVLAGIGGAAALAGIAFDAALVDTAMMGLAVAAGGAAMSSPQSKKTKKETIADVEPETGDVETAEPTEPAEAQDE